METPISAQPSLLRRFCWRTARFIGGAPRRWAWDDQYTRGCWDGLLNRDPFTVALVERLADFGNVIELGCGTGDLAFALRQGSYRSYVGYDVSEIAVGRAKKRATNTDLKNCQFLVSDMNNWVGANDVALIVIEEALYYLSPSQQRSLLRRCVTSLRPNGRILVTAHSGAKHREMLKLCRQTCCVIEERVHGRVHLVLGPATELTPQ